MGLIIKDKIQMMIKGYPTVSDKYNISGAVLAGTTPVGFGELVKASDTVGYFEAITSTVAVSDILGFTVATNVKLNETWPSGGIRINPGEAFNLLVNGFIAVELDAGASFENKAAVAAVASASEDESVVVGKTYYTRSSSSAGAGYLNDGSYAYTVVASPVGDPSQSGYYELSNLGSDAVVDNVVPNAQVAVILATGKLTTADKIDNSTIVALPNTVFTGTKEYHGTTKIAEIYVK